MFFSFLNLAIASDDSCIIFCFIVASMALVVGWVLENVVVWGTALSTVWIAKQRFLYPESFAWGLCCCWIAVFLQYFTLSVLVELSAEVIYKKIPYFNETKRPRYSLHKRMSSYAGFALRWSIPAAGYYILWVPTFREGNFDLSVSYFMQLALKVEVSLLCADLFYWMWHCLQHNVKSLYVISNHGFHHHHYYPIAAAGTWLGFIDLWVSSVLIGSRNMYVAELIFGSLTEFEFCLCLAFVHEMNCCDHSGKQLPFYSGFPLCPPLGLLLRLHESIPMHEAHHNFNHHSYGLLGVADRLFGTARFPKEYPVSVLSGEKK